ncbi:MAG: methylated-DNA--[protein]-cysteine S-methyltransferase [Planctomycetota bacterium]
MLHTYCESPFGDLLLVGDGATVCAIHLPREGQRKDPSPASVEEPGAFADARRELGEYFAGRRETFGFAREQGGTPFQLSVWAELARVPYGATITYGELARRIGRPHAFRAVGTANGRNALPIVVPCHRVVAADGLGGFGGGLAVKRILLDLERRALASPCPADPRA